MEKIVQTAGRNTLGEFAPDFAHFNDDILFGENWNNQDIERYAGVCSRNFYVGEDVKQEDIKAKFKDGVLKLQIPQKEEVLQTVFPLFSVLSSGAQSKHPPAFSL